jgi:molybdopterin-containing oxidoreductase family iron-sulfur binding subunit
MANKQYWKTIGERDKDPEVLEKHIDEFGGTAIGETIANWSAESEGLKVTRRTFLKMAGFTLGATTLAGCRDQVAKIVPYLKRPEGITPGVAYSYASTCLACPCGCGVLTKNRDGRPIKIEGNPDHPISRGGTCAIAQAEVMSLYDSYRYQGPQAGGKTVPFKKFDEEVMQALTKVRLANGRVRVVTGTVTSPTLQRSINRFMQTFVNAEHVSYDSISLSALADSYEKSHGKRFVPHFRFDKADVILSLDADFMGTWLSPTEFAKDYARGRKVTADKRVGFSRHLQIESRLSMTGSNADNRWAMRASEIPAVLGHIIQAVAGSAAPAAARSVPAVSLGKS